MTESRSLAGLNILVAEDEFLVALELDGMIRTLGAEVLGPVSSIDAAIEILENTEIHGAVLDLKLGKETSVRLAERLLADGVPILLTTGYSDQMLPETLAHVPRLSKPYGKVSFQQLATSHFARE